MRSSCQVKRRAGSGSFSIRGVREIPRDCADPVRRQGGDGSVAIQAQPHDLHDQRVIGRRALDVEGPTSPGHGPPVGE